MAAKDKCNFHCCTLPDDVGERIRESVEAGRGRSMFDTDDPTNLNRFHGAQCRCGVHRKPPGLALHMADDGSCPVHPDREPERWSRGAERADG